jgi:hypothetical protein
MNPHRALASLAIVIATCSAITIAAQAPATPLQPPKFSTSLGAAQFGCPVGLRAQRGTGSGLVVTRGFEHHGPAGIAQQLHMTFTNRMPKNAVGVTLTVHGLTATFHKMPATQSAADSSDSTDDTITRTVHLDLTLDPNANVSADLTLKSFTAVSHIDLDAIDYADGSSWKSAATQICRFAPDLLMLVASR